MVVGLQEVGEMEIGKDNRRTVHQLLAMGEKNIKGVNQLLGAFQQM